MAPVDVGIVVSATDNDCVACIRELAFYTSNYLGINMIKNKSILVAGLSGLLSMSMLFGLEAQAGNYRTYSTAGSTLSICGNAIQSVTSTGGGIVVTNPPGVSRCPLISDSFLDANSVTGFIVLKMSPNWSASLSNVSVNAKICLADYSGYVAVCNAGTTAYNLAKGQAVKLDLGNPINAAYDYPTNNYFIQLTTASGNSNTPTANLIGSVDNIYTHN